MIYNFVSDFLNFK